MVNNFGLDLILPGNFAMSVNDVVDAMKSRSINIDIMQILQQDTIAAQHKWTAEQEPGVVKVLRIGFGFL